jgi:hypothetical protein
MKLKLIPLFLLGNPLFAQRTVDVTKDNVSAVSPTFFMVVSGEPFMRAKFAKVVSGSPYYKDEWMRSTIILDSVSRYENVPVKLDLYDNEVHYSGQSGEELIATVPVKQLIVHDSATGGDIQFVNGSMFVPGLRDKYWYQVLTPGNVSLLKRYEKKIQENTPYGSATVEQTIYTAAHYFIFTDGRLAEVRKLKDIPAAIGDPQGTLAGFIKSQKLSGKTEADMQALVQFTNGSAGSKTGPK